jgi:4-hydroxy-2-oxovalerate aldolase
MRAAHAVGANVFKVATHCTEADIAIQHLGLARELGGRAYGGLMMTHMTTPTALAEQAAIMADSGAEAVYVADSAGAMTMDAMRARVAAVRNRLEPDVAVAVHAHNNLGLAVANTLVGVEEGATIVDACLAGFGAGAGNCHLEAIVAVLHRMGYSTGVDLWKAQDVTEEHVRPLMPGPMGIDRDSLVLGFTGIYSSFLLHTRRAAARFGVDSRDILLGLMEYRVVAGQEDLVIEVAARLARQSSPSSTAADTMPAPVASDQVPRHS